jgi:uncharacterized protein (TIGR03437 family)
MSSCHIIRVIAVQVLSAGAMLGVSTSPATVVVSNETVPAGATVQLKFFLSKPALVAKGELVMQLDPTVFASVTTVCAFSANGDAYGFAKITGLNVDVWFGSQSGGVGQLVGMPIVAVTAVVLSTATVGQTASVTPTPTIFGWADPQGNAYTVTASAGTVTVGGSLSIASVTQGGGILPIGTSIEIDGTGFNSAAMVQIDGASIASAQVSNPGKILLTLGGATELTGKRIQITNPDGSEVEAFSFLPGVPVSSTGTDFDGVVPILPLQTYTVATVFVGGNGLGGMAIRNPNPVAVQLLVDTTDAVGDFTGEKFFTIPAGGSILNVVDISTDFFLVIASAPVQIVQLIQSPYVPSAFSAAAPSATTVPALQVTTGLQSGALSWIWQTGGAAPQPQPVSVFLPRGLPPTNVAVSVATSSGGNWLSVTPAGVIACTPSSCSSFQVSANPTGLLPGIYRGTVTLTPVATAFYTVVVPVAIPVAITVTASPFAQTVIAATYLNPNELTAPVTIPPGLFSGSFSLSIVTDSGGNWLSALPNAGSSPTSIVVTANAAGFGVGEYTGDIVISGSGNTLVVPVHFVVEGSIRLTGYVPSTLAYVGSLNFAAQAGSGVLPGQPVSVGNEDCSLTAGCMNAYPDLTSLAASVATHSGGNWLRASVSNGSVLVGANATGLSAGVYLGAVTLTANGVAPGQFPVVLVVETGTTPALVAGPGLFSFNVMTGNIAVYGPYTGALCVSSGSVPLALSAQSSTSDGGSWLHVSGAVGVTPACLAVSVDATALPPGSYSGNIVVTGGAQSVTVPVAVTVTTDGPVQPMLLGSIASAASELPAAVSPGEIIAIHGQNLGPLVPAGPSVSPTGQFSTTVAGVRVLIGGIPAPILYASQNEINTVVPYEIAGQSALSVQVQNVNGFATAWDIPSAASAPGIFTADGTGVGGGTILNQDNSLNTTSNPAAAGTVIQIFATGEGITNPPGKTGTVAQDLHQPVLPAAVTIGGIQAQVVYAGSAPSEIEGLFQVNAMVPAGITTGDAVPVVLKVGQVQSQMTTIAVH